MSVTLKSGRLRHGTKIYSGMASFGVASMVTIHFLGLGGDDVNDPESRQSEAKHGRETFSVMTMGVALMVELREP